MQVVMCKPGKPGEIVEIQNTLKDMQEIVGGHIETVRVSPDCVIVCNEEGRINGSEFNRVGIYGTFFICGTKRVEFTSLTNCLAETIMELLP